MADHEEVRKVAATWHDYLKETGESITVFRWVWRTLIPADSKRVAFRLLLLSFAATGLTMAQPWTTKVIIDGVIAHERASVIIGVAALLVFAVIERFVRLREGYARERVWGMNFSHLNRGLNRLFFAKSLGQHLREGSALNSACMNKGKDQIFNVQSLLLFNNGLVDLFQMFVAAVALWFASPLIGVVILCLFAHRIVWAIALNRRCVGDFGPIEAEYRKLGRNVHELWDKVERVLTTGQGEAEPDLVDRRMKEVVADDVRLSCWYQRMYAVISIVNDAAFVAIVAYTAWNVWQGAWTVGIVIPIVSWSRQFIGDLWRVSQIEWQLNKALPAVKALKTALTMPPDVTDAPDAVPYPDDAVPEIEFNSVGHRYSAAAQDEDAAPSDAKPGQPVLDDIRFRIPSGNKVALIGPSGAGKTTIMRLLQRYADPDSGTVLVDGRDLRGYRLSSWTAAIGYIAQQPQVFDGTVRSNLLFGLPPEARAAVTDDELWTVMRKLRIDFGARLTDGLDTKVGRNGIKLSGGEAQRLMIGAAAMRRPRLMIIDEATSSLDSSTEKEVQQGLAEILRGGISALVIAHRLSTVRHLCDAFVVLSPSDGNVGARVEAVACSFEELYRISPTFRRLADDQGLRIAADPETAVRRDGSRALS